MSNQQTADAAEVYGLEHHSRLAGPSLRSAPATSQRPF